MPRQYDYTVAPCTLYRHTMANLRPVPVPSDGYRPYRRLGMVRCFVRRFFVLYWSLVPFFIAALHPVSFTGQHRREPSVCAKIHQILAHCLLRHLDALRPQRRGLSARSAGPSLSRQHKGGRHWSRQIKKSCTDLGEIAPLALITRCQGTLLSLNLGATLPGSVDAEAAGRCLRQTPTCLRDVIVSLHSSRRARKRAGQMDDATWDIGLRGRGLVSEADSHARDPVLAHACPPVLRCARMM